MGRSGLTGLWSRGGARKLAPPPPKRQERCTRCQGLVTLEDGWQGGVGPWSNRMEAVLLCQDCALALSIWLYGAESSSSSK